MLYRVQSTLELQQSEVGVVSLKNRVREFRELYGLSRQELAAAAGLSLPTIDALEDRDGYTPQMRVALALCGYFNVGLDRIFWIEGLRRNNRAGVIEAADEPEEVAAV